MEVDEEIIECYATPEIQGDGNDPYPWSDTPGTAVNPPPVPRSVNLESIITSWQSHKDGHVLEISDELRTIIAKIIGILDFSATFLQRLKNADVISEEFCEEMKEVQPSIASLKTHFWNHLTRKKLLSLLTFSQLLIQDGHLDAVQDIVDYISQRKLLQGPKRLRSEINVPRGNFYAGSEYYRMTSQPRGYVLIINNERFTKSSGFENREGTEIDGYKLAALFRELSFDIYHAGIFPDLTRQEISKVVETFAKDPRHSKSDASVVCILSHGGDRGIVGVDGEPIRDCDIQDHFMAENCPGLVGKPKIFLFLACRGDGIDNGAPVTHSNVSLATGSQESDNGNAETLELTCSVSTMGTGEVHMESTTLLRRWSQLDSQKIPNSVDFIIIYATVPGYKAFRHKEHGTWFVQDFVEVVAERAGTTDLVAMMYEVLRPVPLFDSHKSLALSLIACRKDLPRL